MRVFWTDRAKQRLRELHDYVALEAPLVAPQIVKRLVRRSRQLQVAPWSGRRVPEYDRDDIRELMVRPYRIIYLVHSDRSTSLPYGTTDNSCRVSWQTCDAQRPSQLFAAMLPECRPGTVRC